ncbi:hypothetical protein B7R54_14715 [Subtercola boreus]|uniref:Uncharacterized protein n=1 Tax=Subtercola boreus TaxID=120213 RepID=A0A3E0VK29_9MICO|nr:hypothetical protein [Subtercola boreus]RFA10322.1 hypothetical protein B7R54_14715 [Subtercola boreus]TQL56172.1 hypothetical protein FB464_3759 [Subtercola boreus]
MLAMTGTLRTPESVRALPLLAQNLRRHHEHLLLSGSQMLVVITGVGTVLVTSEPRLMRFDVVADSRNDFEVRCASLEANIQNRLPGVRTVTTWASSSSIPVPFR